jgi:hypothetical protein
MQKQLADDQEALRLQTQKLLLLHEKCLQQLSSDALSTTRAVIQTQQEQLSVLHQTGQETLKAHQSAMAKESATSRNQMRWLLMWPLLASALLSVLLIVLSSLWSWYQVSELDKKEAATQQRIQQLTNEFCQTPAGLKTCRQR